MKALFYLFIFILGFVLVSIWSFWLVVRPPKIDAYRTPTDYKLTAEEIVLETEDGLELSAWFIETPPLPANKKPAIIFLHGYPAEKSDMLGIASSLSSGFSLFLLDFRYFGKSEGKYTTFGIKERLDVSTALDFLESRGYNKIGILGFSLGGATALMTAEKDARVDAIVSYAAFSELSALGKEIYSHLSVLKYPLVKLMVFWGQILFGESIEKITPLSSAGKINIPVFIIHTKKDEQISFSHAKHFENALENNSKAEFYFPDEGLHGELPFDFNTRVKDFFNRTL